MQNENQNTNDSIEMKPRFEVHIRDTSIAHNERYELVVMDTINNEVYDSLLTNDKDDARIVIMGNDAQEYQAELALINEDAATLLMFMLDRMDEFNRLKLNPKDRKIIDSVGLDRKTIAEIMDKFMIDEVLYQFPKANYDYFIHPEFAAKPIIIDQTSN